MSTITSTDLRYTPASTSAKELVAKLDEYNRAYEIAANAEIAIAHWAKTFYPMKVGDIIDRGQKLPNAWRVGVLDVTGTFAG
jgi:hypothetical protein